MGAVIVVIPKPFAHALTQFQAVFVTAQVDVLILQTPPQPLHKLVVHPPPMTVHAHQHPGFLHGSDIVGGSVCGADHRRSVLGHLANQQCRSGLLVLRLHQLGASIKHAFKRHQLDYSS